MKKITVLKIFFSAICIAMAYLVVATAMKSNLLAVSIDEPWFKTTLIDFYFNTAILSAWVIYKEQTIISRILWIMGFVLTGAIATSLYVVVQLCKLKPGEPFENVLIPQKSSREAQ